jgi:hypothetical protein
MITGREGIMRARLMVAAALLALVACGRSETDVQQSGPGNVTVETPNGSAVVRMGGGAAASLPAGLPAYPGADTSASIGVSGASEQGQGRIVTFTTSDAPAQVIAFYAQAVGAAGYTIANQATMGPTAMLTAQKGPGDTVTVTATQAGTTTQVNIVAAGETP